jgi:hypothetical protein
MFHNEPKVTTGLRPHATAKLFGTPNLVSPLKISPDKLCDKQQSIYDMFTGWSAGITFSLLLGHPDRLWGPLCPL